MTARQRVIVSVFGVAWLVSLLFPPFTYDYVPLRGLPYRTGPIPKQTAAAGYHWIGSESPAGVESYRINGVRLCVQSLGLWVLCGLCLVWFGTPPDGTSKRRAAWWPTRCD